MMKQIEFRPPEGSVPEGKMSGDEFDSVCTFRVKNNGTVCLVMLGDAKMPGYDSKEPMQRPGYGDMAKQMQDDMGEQS